MASTGRVRVLRHLLYILSCRLHFVSLGRGPTWVIARHLQLLSLRRRVGAGGCLPHHHCRLRADSSLQVYLVASVECLEVDLGAVRFVLAGVEADL